MRRGEIMGALLDDYIFAGGEMLTVGEYYQRIAEYYRIREIGSQKKNSKGKIRNILKKWEKGIPVERCLRGVDKGSRYNPRGRYDFRAGGIRHNEECYSLRRR